MPGNLTVFSDRWLSLVPRHPRPGEEEGVWGQRSPIRLQECTIIMQSCTRTQSLAVFKSGCFQIGL